MKKLLCIICIIGLIAGCSSPKSADDPAGSETTAAELDINNDPATVPAVTEPPTPPEPEYRTIRAVAVGDNLIHSSIYGQARRRAGENGGSADDYCFEWAYKNIRHLVEGFDLSMINQETLVNRVYPPANFPFFSTPPQLGDLMVEMGFNAFTIANNHTIDLKTSGLLASLDYWDEKIAYNDIAVVGAYRNIEDRSNIRTLEIGGLTVSLLGYTEHLNGLRLPADTIIEIGDSKDLDRMEEEIRRAKEISDVCVVFLHWGAENADRIQDYQREAARRMVDAGADIVHGTHPHVLRDMEYMEREDGSRAIIMYSLANFISSQDIPQTMISGIVTFDITVSTATGAVVISEVLLTPIITHYDGFHRDVRLYPLSEYTREMAGRHGVRQFGEFNYDYIIRTIRRTVSEEWLPANWDE
jgi:poly-gamma-glutamate synthesis protein (capsule biosynthesis protein)